MEEIRLVVPMTKCIRLCQVVQVINCNNSKHAKIYQLKRPCSDLVAPKEDQKSKQSKPQEKTSRSWFKTNSRKTSKLAMAEKKWRSCHGQVEHANWIDPDWDWFAQSLNCLFLNGNVQRRSWLGVQEASESPVVYVRSPRKILQCLNDKTTKDLIRSMKTMRGMLPS